MPLKVFTPSATLPRTSPYRVLTTVFIGLPPSKRVARRGATSADSVFRSGLLRLDRGVVETIAALNQFFQPLGETCRRCAIDDLVIKTERQAQIVPDGDVPVNDPRLLANATHRHHEWCRGGWRDTPARTVPKHAYCRDAHRPHVLLPQPWMRSPYPGEDPEVGFKEKSRKGLKPHQVFCHILHLGCPDLVMNLAQGLAIGCSDNGRQDLFLASHVMLNREIHVHLIKQDEALAAFAIGLHGFVLSDGLCQAGSEERRERQGLPSLRLVLSEVSARPGHIDFEQAMDHGLVLDGTKHGRHPPPDLRIGDHLVIIVFLFHHCSISFCLVSPCTRFPVPAEHRCGGTINIGSLVALRTPSVTLPIIKRSNPPRPWVDMAIRSHPL